MYPHDGVMALLANETGFCPFEGSQMLVVLHAWRELDGLADGRTVQETVEVDPFAAIAGPRLATKGNSQASRKHALLKFAQVFTDQLWFLLPQLRAEQCIEPSAAVPTRGPMRAEYNPRPAKFSPLGDIDPWVMID
jgi:hypothetical protein